MSRLKWLTQRVSMLLFIPLVIVGVPLALATVGRWLGFWEAIDTLLSSNQLLFWVLLLISRGIFGAVWLFLGYWIGVAGEVTGWFWFKPERSSYYREEDSVDKSGIIVAIFVAMCFFIFISEFATRLSTLTSPPYLPPPAQ